MLYNISNIILQWHEVETNCKNTSVAKPEILVVE